MRYRFAVVVVLMGGLTLLLGPTQGLTQIPGRDRGGRGGRGGFDPSAMFDRFAQGATTINIATLQFGREEAKAWAQKYDITTGQMTRAQVTSYRPHRTKRW